LSDEGALLNGKFLIEGRQQLRTGHSAQNQGYGSMSARGIFQQLRAEIGGRKLELSWPVEADYLVLGNERNEQEVQERYRDTAKASQAFLLNFTSRPH
jgi:hypothetical protein